MTYNPLAGDVSCERCLDISPVFGEAVSDDLVLD